MRAGDKFWFPPHETGEERGGIFTVQKVQTIPRYGECVFWTDGTWCQVKDLKDCFEITEDFIRELWVRASEDGPEILRKEAVGA